MKKKKIAFCITCMNRLAHLQQTLIKNIEDNYQEEVEFVLLDYNSTDGLEKWVRSLKKYLKNGMLVYYRTSLPESYHRSHSRNMAFRLANAELICMLDADNYLGEGFAAYVLQLFEKNEKTFVTSNYYVRDLAGRVCLRKKDFEEIRGYNELISGYGYEDIDFFDRLLEKGLKQEIFEGSLFSKVIKHSEHERILKEPLNIGLKKLYLAYTTPYMSEFILLYTNGRYKTGSLVNNEYYYYNISDRAITMHERSVDARYRRVLNGDMQEGCWEKQDEKLILTLKDKELLYSTSLLKINNGIIDFYEIENLELRAAFIIHLSNAINFKEATAIREAGKMINSQGYGQGSVFKNFDHRKEIVLK